MTINTLIGFKNALIKVAQPTPMQRYTFAEVFALARKLRELANKPPTRIRRLLY
jgi:hypothetical protein